MIARPTAKRLMDVVKLDPRQAISPNTLTLRLWKVEDGISVHFVYEDKKHGTYCSVHGRECPAVEQAKVFDQQEKNK